MGQSHQRSRHRRSSPRALLHYSGRTIYRCRESYRPFWEDIVHEGILFLEEFGGGHIVVVGMVSHRDIGVGDEVLKENHLFGGRFQGVGFMGEKS